jgi:Tfp pilus assembly protein PilF
VILFDFGNDIEGALEKARNEFKIRPENIHVNTLLARIYAAQGEIDLAKKHLAKATRTGSLGEDLQELQRKLS